VYFKKKGLRKEFMSSPLAPTEGSKLQGEKKKHSIL